MAHHHHHSHLAGGRLKLTIALNVFITIAEVVAGFASGSLALLSDATHNFSDIVALFVSFIALKLARKENTPQQTFGYQRAEIVAALFNSATLLFIAFMLCYEAVSRITDPQPVATPWVIGLAALSVVVNLASAALLHRESQHNINIRSSYQHLVSDALTSIAVLLGGVAMSLTPIYWLDGLLSIGIALYLVYSSWGLISQTIKVLMQFAPEHLEIANMVADIQKIEDIDNVHHVHIWQLTDRSIHFEAHLEFRRDLKLSEISAVMNEVRAKLSHYGIRHSVLQPEIGVEDAKNLIAKTASCSTTGNC